jgi:hypothetical protein
MRSMSIPERERRQVRQCSQQDAEHEIRLDLGGQTIQVLWNALERGRANVFA